MTLPINLAELDLLERLAKGATPGPWRDRPTSQPTEALLEIGNVMHRPSESRSIQLHKRDAAFIAAANPATLLALISQLRAAMEVISEARSVLWKSRASSYSPHKPHVDALEDAIRAYDAIAGETK